MEYAKDEIFNIRYNELTDRLEFGKKKRIANFIKQHKIMSTVIATTIVAIGIDSVLIYQFFSLLSTL